MSSDYFNSTAPDKLTSRHRLLMRALITGMSQKEAGEACGFTPVRVCQLVNSPLFKHEMERMQFELEERFLEKASNAFDPALEARKLINEAAVDAATILINLSKTASSEAERGKSARDILDRGGVVKTERHEIDANITLPTSVVESISAAISTLSSPLPINTENDENQDDSE